MGDEYYERISECIPQIKFDAWGKYQWVGDYDPLPIWAKIHQSNQRTYYGKDTVNEIIDELCKLQTSGSTDAQIDEWFEVRRLSNAAKVRRLQLIENWCETSRIEHLCASAAFKRKRAAFYDDHAGRMGLDLATLANCPSYKRFTAIAKPVTLRSWTILLKNLQKDDWKEWKDVVQANDEARRHLESMHTNFTAYRGNWWDIVGNGPCGP